MRQYFLISTLVAQRAIDVTPFKRESFFQIAGEVPDDVRALVEDMNKLAEEKRAGMEAA